ncbi:hypothetical protein ACFYT4_24995 [Streptomyces sp. NPDC004609]|uniref:hypothetical protein n=1 Tax=Streptomyces sp. NPDC004609 TaxID=3364704 RepID=UPI003682E1DF
MLTQAWSRGRPTREDQAKLDLLQQEYQEQGRSDTDPIPMFAVAQLYRRDVPDLPGGPDGRDLLQVFWCPFDLHGPTGYDMSVHLTWRHSHEVRDVLTNQPEPDLVGSDGYVPDPCVLYPEQVTEYPSVLGLPEDLDQQIMQWDEAQEIAGYEAARASGGDGGSPLSYESDLSIPPGWKAGGYAAVEHPEDSQCHICGRGRELLLRMDSYEWLRNDGLSWRPIEEAEADPELMTPNTDGLPEIVVGNWGRLSILTCPGNPAHPHHLILQ